jgi:methylated-DNA-[protein]-cysteine S-methyltransferase
MMAVVATERGLARVLLPTELAKGGVPERPRGMRKLPGGMREVPSGARERPGGTPTPPLRGHAAGAGERACPRESGPPRRAGRGHDRRSAAQRHAATAEREIRQYLAGRRRRFTVPLDMAGLAPFHKKVLQACRRIRYGKVLTYAQLAGRSGRPQAARAVGQAMARNPIALVVPCHRVIAAGGGLGGYGGGLRLKRLLLRLEEAMV